MKYLLILLAFSGCAGTQHRYCLDYSKHRAKYVRQYVADEISVDTFQQFNHDLDIYQELGIPDCEDLK